MNLPEHISSKLVYEQRSERVSTPCWVWTGCTTDNGYAISSVGGEQLVHRGVYRLLVGEITEETLDHLCLIKTCVNPEHMDPCSYQENKRRGMALRETCRFGHELDGVRKRPNGATSRYCKQCQARFQREARVRKKAAA
ncbi:HNH endonuclease [Mycobacterium phage Cali]|uniref:HNH endonuclease n=10 Tax=Bixzunavirus TaxID=680114 RepID=Q853E3_BPMBZ|nr:HNH endonuclease [Mycobacterium phage Bxz1]YP_002224609.1 HNH endonuclease [Mycobacterium phage Cali]YP_009221266.1 HNH endonuclease [Mycobacterium phage Breeniome]YP_009597730.1 HNH endonuclease [Mycobacterium phage Lukilu]YP_010057314.1 HNH endonuclease [Mycobacterium phage Cane17]YP_010057543.1 HNH endonuclease [Mycobacterium phage CharlieB]YP_010057777.1 HNH endonuclease [Mycobacterium phage Mangeria]ACU41658.1 HNH endonuclease [Mycobacterium phage LRRHood]AER49654.1 hypothetical pro